MSWSVSNSSVLSLPLEGGLYVKQIENQYRVPETPTFASEAVSTSLLHEWDARAVLAESEAPLPLHPFKPLWERPVESPLQRVENSLFSPPEEPTYLELIARSQKDDQLEPPTRLVYPNLLDLIPDIIPQRPEIGLTSRPLTSPRLALHIHEEEGGHAHYKIDTKGKGKPYRHKLDSYRAAMIDLLLDRLGTKKIKKAA
jgi:hypothetical protein